MKNCKLLNTFLILCCLTIFLSSCKQRQSTKPKIQIGMDAPDFNLPDKEDVFHQLSDYKNKTISIQTMEEIKAGKELTINYSAGWDEWKPVWFDTVD